MQKDQNTPEHKHHTETPLLHLTACKSQVNRRLKGSNLCKHYRHYARRWKLAVVSHMTHKELAGLLLLQWHCSAICLASRKGHLLRVQGLVETMDHLVRSVFG